MTRLPSPLLRLALLASVALAAVAAPAQALVIDPVFEASWNNNAPAGATTVINNVIKEFENDFSNPVIVTIQFGWGDLNGGSIGGALGVTNFPQVLNALSFPTGVAQYSLTQTTG